MMLKSYYREKAREYRKTDKYKSYITEYMKRPEVILRRKINRKQINRVRRESLTQKERRLSKKRLVIDHYSDGSNKCECCGEPILEFLSINHIIDRKSVGHGRKVVGDVLYGWLIKHDFPCGYNVLCMQCNWAEDKFDICPHKKTNDDWDKEL